MQTHFTGDETINILSSIPEIVEYISESEEKTEEEIQLFNDYTFINETATETDAAKKLVNY